MNWRAARNALTLVVALIVLWQLIYLVVGEIAMRSPLATLRYTLHLVGSATFWPHLSETARAFAAALAIAIALGLAIGFWLGFHRFSGEVMEPMLVALYSIPKITLYPLVLLAFGLGMPAKIAFGALHGIVPIAIFTINALRNIKPIFIKTARAHNLRIAETVRVVLFPAAIPEIFAGIRVGFSLTLIGTILGEMFRGAAWAWLPPDERHRFAQRGCHHGCDLAAGGVCGEREQHSAMGRSAAAFPGVTGIYAQTTGRDTPIGRERRLRLAMIGFISGFFPPAPFV